MKKHNIILKIFALTSLLVVLLSSLTSCTHLYAGIRKPTAIHEWGCFNEGNPHRLKILFQDCYHNSPKYRSIYGRHEIRIAASSNVNRFSKDDVTINLYLAFATENPKGYDKKIYYVLYVKSPSGRLPNDFRDIQHNDYRTAFSDEYTVLDTFNAKVRADEEYFCQIVDNGSLIMLDSIKYNHSREITIPDYIFEEGDGEFEIGILSFREKGLEADGYFYTYENLEARVIIDYSCTDGKVELKNYPLAKFFIGSVASDTFD